MATARLLIDGVEADVFSQDDLSPRIVKQGFTTELERAAIGDYTLNLKLPVTPANRGNLRNAGDYQLADGFYTLPDFKGTIEIDGATAIAGRLLVDKYTPTAYECQIVGENVDWVRGLAAKTLRDIQSMPTLLYTGLRGPGNSPWPAQEPNSVTTWQVWNAANPATYQMRLPLLCYGNFEVPLGETTANPIDPTFNVSESRGEYLTRFILNTLAFPLSQFAFRPAGHVRSILQAIFRDVGYQVGGSFFDDPATEEMIVPFTDSSGGGVPWNWALIGQWATEVATQTVTRFLFPVPDFEEVATPDTVLKDYSFAWADPANAYLAPVGGSFSITMSYDLTSVSGLPLFTPVQVRLQAYRNILNDPASLLAETAITNAAGQSASLTFTADLEIGDRLAFGFWIDAFPSGPTPINYSFTVENILLSATPTTDAEGNAWPFALSVAQCLPDINQADFVRDLCRLFNLFVSFSDGVVRLDAKATYFLPPSTALDLTEFADLEQASAEPVLSPRTVWLKSGRQQGETLLLPEAGDFIYTNDSAYAYGQEIVEAMFAPTPIRQMQVYNGTDPGVPIPLPTLARIDEYRTPLGDLTGVAYDYTPRLLVWLGFEEHYGTLPEFSPGQNCLAVGATTTGPGVGGTNVFPTDSRIPAAEPAAVLFNTTGPAQWTDWLNTLKRGQRIKLPAHIQPSTFAQANARRLIKIGSHLFAMEKIDSYNPVRDTTCQLVLIKL